MRDIRISSHPHMDEKQARPFVEQLIYTRDWMDGIDPFDPSEEPDHAAIARFKEKIAKNSKNIAVK